MRIESGNRRDWLERSCFRLITCQKIEKDTNQNEEEEEKTPHENVTASKEENISEFENGNDNNNREIHDDGENEKNDEYNSEHNFDLVDWSPVVKAVKTPTKKQKNMGDEKPINKNLTEWSPVVKAVKTPLEGEEEQDCFGKDWFGLRDVGHRRRRPKASEEVLRGERGGRFDSLRGGVQRGEEGFSARRRWCRSRGDV